jgi:hypothetical protein
MDKEKRLGHTPLWPAYLEKFPTERTLALFRENVLITEHGEILEADTFPLLFTCVFDYNLLTFVINLTDDFPYLDDCVHNKKVQVICNKEGKPTCVRLTGKKNSSRWIIPESSWDRAGYERKQREKNPDFILSDKNFVSFMRQTYDHFALGTRPTPSSCGVALLRDHWKQNNLSRISGCNRSTARFLYEHRIGSRCDLFVEKGSFFDELIELDMATAFGAMYCQKIPVGSGIKFLGNDCWQFFTFFCECTVTIPNELALGPFPVRKAKQSKIVYPTLPGTYQTYLWKEQIEDALQVGCKVEIHKGFGWHDSTEDMTIPSQHLYHLRNTAPNDWIEVATKKITTGAYGRFGMNNSFYSLVDEESSDFGQGCITDSQNNPLDYFVKEEKDYSTPSMIHWYSYNLMQCTRALYQYALPYAREGRLIMTNYDAIIVMEKDETHRYAKKHSLEALLCSMGDLRWKRLTNVTIKGERSVVCDQYTVLPGVKRV